MEALEKIRNRTFILRSDQRRLLDALEGVLEVLDNYPAPSKWNDPSGEILTAMEGMERVIRRTVTAALEADK